MPALSAVVITYNNQDSIADTLRAIAWCDEILVVDAGSIDRTTDICRQFGCRVIQRSFDGFGRQKNFAVTAARYDWVLVVDSDEIVTPELREQIRRRLESDSQPYAGFEIPISLLFMGHLMRFGGQFGKRHLRLFDRRTGNYNLAEVHERVILQGKVGLLDGHIRHASYRDIEHYFDKFNRYTSVAAQQALARQRHVSKWYVTWRFPLTFLHLYLAKGLILDGYPGFVWALFSALYPTVKYIKLEELRSRAAAAP
jgi:glycosyltransferase involved in cell wall biosynthesis